MRVVEFKNEGTFEAMRAAEAWLAARGFSVGPSQVCAPRAIWHGDCWISKWRNLSAKEKSQAHALMDGDCRNGPVTITLRAVASAEAQAAFALTDAEIAARPTPTHSSEVGDA